MDEEDSQDELINRNATHGKGKRPALWAISDEDSDDGGEESEEVASDSGEEEEEHLDGEEDEGEEEDDSDDDEEEDAVKEVEGAVGGVSADLAGLSSDEDTEKCPICLNSFHSQPVATPESCKHYFCLDCILEWSKNANSCPVDRIVFNNIYLRKCYGGKVQKMITVQKPVKEGQEEVIDLELEQTSCEVCGGSDREDRLLLCDGCDAGYHMECLTPPLDAVPVEEWFCPECQANNRHSRGSEEQSDVESLSSARPTTSRSRPRTTGPTRAIARTQQSERVRASVNRHRITQARTAQVAPSFLMPQSTWLDDTINAVVAGLNTAVYIRDLTPRAPSSRRRRTVKCRKGNSKRSSSATGEKGKSAGTGVKRRKRRVRRSKSRRKMVVKKEPTSRGRIAHNLGIGNPKWGSSLPSVYRPTETTLGSMRADIGAASLSVYGDPFDLDPFTDRNEEEEEHASAMTSLLEAKRHGLSRSALRSHQPVARPITAGLSRRGPSLPQVAALAPVPDLLGSILSGQSMLLMDSSDVVINRDGSLKATKPANPALASTVCFRINASGNAWHARQLSNASAMVAAGNSQEPLSTEEEAAKRRREERSSKQRPPATSHTQVKEEEGDIYDPFHPTGSDSNASESEGESHAGGKPSMAHKECAIYQVKAEAMENRVSLERDEGSGEVLDVKSEADTAKPCHGPHNAPRSGMTGTSTPLSQRHVPGKRERKEQGGENGQTGKSREPQSQKTDNFSSISASSHHVNKMLKTEIKSEPQDSPPKSPSWSKSNSRPSGHGRKTSKGGGSSTERRSTSNSPEAGRRRGDKAPEQQGRKRGDEEDKRGEEGGERGPRRLESRERRLRCSPSDSSTSEASERSRKKKTRSCSLSKDRRRSRSRSGSGSSSRERPQSRKQKMGSRERNDSRGSEREKGRPSKTKKRGRSQSRSRSRERRKDHSRSQPSSSGSKNRVDVRSKDKKRPRSRSRSRERRKEEGSSHGTHRPGSFSTTSSKELEEQEEKKREKALTRKEEREAEAERKEREIKQEMPSSSSGLKPHSLLSVYQVKKESDGNEFRTEKHASLSAKLLKESKLLKEIKKEILPAFDMFEESLDSKPIKEEKPLSMFSEFKDLQQHKEIKKEKPPPLINEACALPTSDITEQKDQVLKETKTEPIWLELPQQLTSITAPPTGQPSPSFSTLRTNPVPAPSQAAVTTACQQVAPSLPLVPKALTETPPSVQTIPVKKEVEEHSDYELDDMDVDMMLDSLDYVKSEKAEPGGEKGEAGVKEAKEGEGEDEEVKTVTPGVKAKPSVKRVTWNLQEPDGPQPEKTGSKLALYKLKLKQEGARRPASSTQASNQEAALGATSPPDPKVQSTKRASVSVVLPSAPSSSNSLPQVGLSKPVQGEPNEAPGEDDASRNDNYIKKLHMQERAIKEVKLAIKPFYQKKDITKEEYKEIVRKAVQKICHSKSGEINPVKVAILVKAYVDKYKHDRKHRKGEDGGKTEEAETDRTNDPETP
ncbi:PHD and RING finger domain-containing protein 1 isoform X3 [Salvelinus fontinalis]|uniref:PHD and RING finger domain-containing protein 1 isoform X3 n=1 Tax=Salvelinus fontinalis TaxID=8038 RepID=UPI00248542C9|nr:PHD and RING finger domain-containing protein 1 isoform X3 [Salvelinus fontinalis]